MKRWMVMAALLFWIYAFGTLVVAVMWWATGDLTP